MTSQTLLIGLDGATFDVLDPLMDRGVMPFLKSFAEGGARADLRTVVPPLTPPAWTSLLTGRTPGHHGVFDFFQLEAAGSKRIRLTTAKDVCCRTVADVANQNGLSASVLNFPVHFPPPPIEGTVIAGWMPWRQLRLGCHPPELYDQLKALPAFNPRELAMDMALEARATEGAGEEEYGEWVEMHARRDEHWSAILRHLMAERPAALTAILFDGPDKVQHLCWRFLDPALAANLSAEEEAIQDACLSYYRRLDRVLADIVSAAGPQTTVVIASDHGFGATTEVFHINTWLEQAGYLTWRDGAFAGGNVDGLLGMNQLTRHTDWIDWTQTKAYAATPTSNGIHIVMADENDGNGVTREAYSGFRAELIKALGRVTDGASDEPIVTEVWTREEVFPGAATRLAPDLTLTLRDGGLVSILPAADAVEPRPLPVGTHRPVGVFLVNGPHVCRGERVGELSILDVAPLMLYSLGLGIPQDLEGRVPLEVYEPDFQMERRVEVVAAVDGSTQDANSASAATVEYDEEAEAVIMARLRDLGYVE